MNHEKKAIFCNSPDRANSPLIGLVGVANLLCAGRAPFSIQPYLCDATILACRKKGGGLCSIAGGEVLHCLTSKCVSQATVQADAMVDFSNAFNSMNCAYMFQEVRSQIPWVESCYGSQPELYFEDN